tara:strand:+ start:159 stop:293 length:135 start_codon:yes stop_codon:yes gene_type:complete
MINGTGTYNWPDGRSYIGEWVDNKMSGKGTYTFGGIIIIIIDGR